MPSRPRRSMLAAIVSSAMFAGILIGVTQTAAVASVTSVRGSACGYSTNVGLGGGPQTLHGCGESVLTTDPTFSPFVNLPSGGSATITQTDADGAKGQYGPAVIFGGIWPAAAGSAPPSGPLTATTAGTLAGGVVTSSADISLRTPPDPLSPGGYGPFPVDGDALHVSCSASATAVSGTTTITNGHTTTSTDVNGDPVNQETVPVNPPVNYTRSGVITNVGDVFTVVYNEQIVNSDGSLTVNAVHMYLFGPFAVGDVIKGSVTCGTTPSPLATTDTVAPTCGTPVVEPIGPDNPAPMVPRTELAGVFDARGLQSITNIHVINGTVAVGNSASSEPYLQFVPGQTGPLAITTTRANEALPMWWSFDATDVAGNVTHCRGVPPTSLSINDISVNEGNSGTSPATFTVSRSGDPTGASTVQYKTNPGTAAAGTDYTTVPLTTLSFAAGETAKTVTVNVVGDTLAEANETFTVALSAPTGAVISDTTGSATIVDNDTTYLSVNDLSVNEGNAGTTPATFTVTRSGNTAAASSVKYKTTAGTATATTDYTTLALTTLNFAAGQTSLPVTVSVKGDTVIEPNEAFTLTLSTPSAGTVVSDTSGTGTIRDDDGSVDANGYAFLSVGDMSVIEGNSGTTTYSFIVTRSGNFTGTSTVKFQTTAGTATAGTDYTSLPLTTLTFAPGETFKPVNVSVTGDTGIEPNETFNLVLSTPSAGTAISDTTAVATIVNDD